MGCFVSWTISMLLNNSTVKLYKAWWCVILSYLASFSSVTIYKVSKCMTPSVLQSVQKSCSVFQPFVIWHALDGCVGTVSQQRAVVWAEAGLTVLPPPLCASESCTSEPVGQVLSHWLKSSEVTFSFSLSNKSPLILTSVGWLTFFI